MEHGTWRLVSAEYYRPKAVDSLQTNGSRPVHLNRIKAVLGRNVKANFRKFHLLGSGCSGDFKIENGRSLLLFGDALASFECDPGYEIVGSAALSCNGRMWNTSIPTCQGRLLDAFFGEQNGMFH